MSRYGAVDNDQIADALLLRDGVQAAAARDLGMNDGAFGARLRRYPYLRELARELRQGQERLGVVRPTPSLCGVIEGAFVGLRRSARVGVFAS